MSRIDEIRKRISPEQYLQGLRATKAVYEEQLINGLTQRDVIESASLNDTEEVLRQIDQQILELDARITEIDERLGAAASGAMGLPRAARRRAEKLNGKSKEEIPSETVADSST